MIRFITKVKTSIKKIFDSAEYLSISQQIVDCEKAIIESKEACKRLNESHDAFCIYVDMNNEYSKDEKEIAYKKYKELKLK